MLTKRIQYLLFLGGSILLYRLSGLWVSRLLLWLTLLLPWFSLAVSWRSMGMTRLTISCPSQTVRGARTEVRLVVSGSQMPARACIAVRRLFPPQRWKNPATLPTDCCGLLEIAPECPWVYDYLGLFRRRPVWTAPVTTAVLPAPLPPDAPSVPVPPEEGGCRLREYRPGDPIRQIHWKLTAKTGLPILREPEEMQEKPGVLLLERQASVREWDNRLGNLVFVSQRLLQASRPHRIRCLTGSGLAEYSVATPKQLTDALLDLLAVPPIPGGHCPPDPDALWNRRIAP